MDMEDWFPEPEEIPEPQEGRDTLRKEFGDGKGIFTDGSRMKKERVDRLEMWRWGVV